MRAARDIQMSFAKTVHGRSPGPKAGVQQPSSAGMAGPTPANGTEQTDSHKKSLSEALVNSFGGYPIGYGIGIVILPMSMGWIREDPLTANLAITLVYASVSFARSYLLRRVFERLGIDDNFIRMGIKLGCKIRSGFGSRRSPLCGHAGGAGSD